MSQEAYRKAPREKLAYVIAVVPDQSRPDYLMTIDLDPDSSSYSKVRLPRRCQQLQDVVI